MKIQEVETLEHLREWVKENLPGALVELSDKDVIIRTGLDIDLGGYLHPIERN